MTKHSTLSLLLLWGKEQPSGQVKRVKSLATDRVYDMSLNGFLYYIKPEETIGEWAIL